MKKLAAAGCCLLFLQSFPHFASAKDLTDQATSGKRVLIKAIAAIINSEASRKAPQKRIVLPGLERLRPETEIGNQVFWKAYSK